MPSTVIIRFDDKPSLTHRQVLSNFIAATAGWAKAGFPVTTEAAYQARLAICEPCEHWKPTVLGMHKCNLCGCTRLKLFLATEKCPLKKWLQMPAKPR